MRYKINRDKKNNAIKNSNVRKKIMQTSGANNEHKHSKIQRFSTLNKRIITFWLQRHCSSPFRFQILASFSLFYSKLKRLCQLSISSVTCTNQSLRSVDNTRSTLAFNSNGPTTSIGKCNTKQI